VVVVNFVWDRSSEAVKEVVVGPPRGCFRTSDVAKGTLKGYARSITAVDDGEGPYGRQLGVDKVQKTNDGGRFSVLVRHRGWRLRWLCGPVPARILEEYCWLVRQCAPLCGLSGTVFARSPSEDDGLVERPTLGCLYPSLLCVEK